MSGALRELSTEQNCDHDEAWRLVGKAGEAGGPTVGAPVKVFLWPSSMGAGLFVAQVVKPLTVLPSISVALFSLGFPPPGAMFPLTVRAPTLEFPPIPGNAVQFAVQGHGAVECGWDCGVGQQGWPEPIAFRPRYGSPRRAGAEPR